MAGANPVLLQLRAWVPQSIPNAPKSYVDISLSCGFLSALSLPAPPYTERLVGPVGLTSLLHCSESPLAKAWRAGCLGTPGPGPDREPGAPSSVGRIPLPSAFAG